jgi:hypothetical protein
VLDDRHPVAARDTRSRCCLLFLFRKQHSFVSPLLEAGALTTMSLHPTILAVQVVVASKTPERRIVLTYDAPGVDLVVDAPL